MESYAQTPFHDHSCSTVSWGQITFLGRVILLCPNYLHMDVNDGEDLSPSISSRWLLDNFYCCFYAWLACTANSPSSTKTLAGLLLVLSDLGIARWHRTMSPVRGPWASVMMFPIRVLRMCWFTHHFSSVDTSAAPNRNMDYPQVPSSIPADVYVEKSVLTDLQSFSHHLS